MTPVSQPRLVRASPVGKDGEESEVAGDHVRCSVLHPMTNEENAVSEASGTSKLEIRRAWKYTGEDEGSVHIELAAGDETLNVHLKGARNPRLVEFILKNATVATEERPAKEAKDTE